uniref:Uncharacterized protein n=1 Tax=Acrobeloides nanus TaxID=290746 RepID=A0A914CXI1_9BILA
MHRPSDIAAGPGRDWCNGSLHQSEDVRCWQVALEEVAMTEESATLVEFLLARVEEDERIADHVASVSPTTDTGFCVWATQFAFDAERMIVAVDYQRVFAECAAKRRIVEAFRTAAPAQAETLGVVLRELAFAYADHPDHRSGWRI